MKLYTFETSPNGKRMTWFLAEKGIEVPLVHVDIPAGATRQPAFQQINSLGEIPVLELEDGRCICESVAICRYLEGLHPATPLMGTDPLSQGRIEMWNRRMEQQILGPLVDMALHSMDLFADKIEQVPAYVETLPRRFQKNLSWLDEELADGRTWACDDRFSIADITGMTALYIMGLMDIPVPGDLTHVNRWAHAAQARPSWQM